MNATEGNLPFLGPTHASNADDTLEDTFSYIDEPQNPEPPPDNLGNPPLIPEFAYD